MAPEELERYIPLIALNSYSGFTVTVARKLLEAFTDEGEGGGDGDVLQQERALNEAGRRRAYDALHRFWQAPAEDLLAIENLGDRSGEKSDERIKEKIITIRNSFKPKEILEKIEDKGIRLLSFLDELYPTMLQEIGETAPPLLFFIGDPEVVWEDCVSIVGCRKASPYGRKVAMEFAGQLAELGLTIVSGMALGIDSCAHEGALAVGGKTAAVLGSGLDDIYPPQNLGLFRRICDRGLVMSEFNPGTPPNKENFPRRNRIIAGLSKATVVVEAPIKSGSLITAGLAANLGREVLAIPGSVYSENSEGCHKLINDGARLASSIDEILFALNMRRSQLVISADEELGEEERRLLQTISYQGTHINALAKELSLDIKEVAGQITMLEVRGLVSSRGGGYYIRL